MIYSIKKANLIAEQLEKFTHGYVHHLAGHHANIDFWMDEVKSAKHTLDGHRRRFDQLVKGQSDWVQNHDVVVYDYCPICKGQCELSDGTPALPQMKYKSEILETKKQLLDAAYYFLIHCYNTGVMPRQQLSQIVADLEMSIDSNDLKVQ